MWIYLIKHLLVMGVQCGIVIVASTGVPAVYVSSYSQVYRVLGILNPTKINKRFFG